MNGFHDPSELQRQIEALRTAMGSIRRMQKALVHPSVLEGVRRAQEDARRMQKALARPAGLEGIRRTLEAWNNSSLAFNRAIQAVRVDVLDLRVGDAGERLATHVTEVEVTRERAQGRDLLGRRLRKVRKTARNRLVRLASRRKIRRPVGGSLRGVAEFVFSKKSFEQIYDPLISDLRVEHFDALASNRKWKAPWVRARGYRSFLAAVVAHVAASGGHLVVRVWRIFQVGG